MKFNTDKGQLETREFTLLLEKAPHQEDTWVSDIVGLNFGIR
jgi:hypothetical protein